MKFEWDEHKNQANINKHKISFEQASTVFLDGSAIIFQDVEHSETEERFIIIGKSALEQVLFVCYCEKSQSDSDEEVIRIISARKATNKERRLFYE